MTADAPAIRFFEELYAASEAWIAAAPLTRRPVPMAHVQAVLEPALAALPASFVQPDPALPAAMLARAGAAAAGLNTVGMLLDRLSILAIKQWNMACRSADPEKAATLRQTQVQEIIEALAAARPGHSSLNTKITRHAVSTRSAGFADAYAGLLMTNLLLWEAQEVLYNHDMPSLPCEELRAYITFFSRGNLIRNGFIEESDRQFWSGADA